MEARKQQLLDVLKKHDITPTTSDTVRVYQVWLSDVTACSLDHSIGWQWRHCCGCRHWQKRVTGSRGPQ